jgi:outer membrane protein W
MILLKGLRMKKQFALTAAAALLALASVASAHAENITLDVLGGVGFSNPSIKSAGIDADKSSKAAFIGGLGANYFFDSSFSVELDALYAQRAFTVKGTPDAEYKLNTIQIPVLARYWILPSNLSVGVGGYYAETIGDGKVNDVSFKPGDLGLNRPDFGLIGSIQGRYAVAANVQVLLDARYNFGLVNQNVQNDDNNSYKTRDLTLLAGVGYSF